MSLVKKPSFEFEEQRPTMNQGKACGKQKFLTISNSFFLAFLSKVTISKEIKSGLRVSGVGISHEVFSRHVCMDFNLIHPQNHLFLLSLTQLISRGAPATLNSFRHPVEIVMKTF
jgi:hypothetical protein